MARIKLTDAERDKLLMERDNLRFRLVTENRIGDGWANYWYNKIRAVEKTLTRAGVQFGDN